MTADGVTAAGRALVLDTNIVLDLLVFRDPSTLALAASLSSGERVWHATPAMREELRRVLGYPAVQTWIGRTGGDAGQVMQQFDRLSQVHPEVATGAPRCRDPDDQKFIDLALALSALLLSKDQEVLRLRRALAARGVVVATCLSPAA
jgi:putative PIN family toxin of toxin-antitoxin system